MSRSASCARYGLKTLEIPLDRIFHHLIGQGNADFPQRFRAVPTPGFLRIEEGKPPGQRSLETRFEEPP
jgi:hypothetical protein